MAISISSRPDKTRGSYDSYWVAANNPVMFSFDTSGSPLDDAVQVALYEEDGTTQIVELQVIPFPSSNEIELDISAFLQSELNNDDDSLTNKVTSDPKKENQFKIFKIGYRADGTGSYTVDSTEYIAVNNVKQAGETYGGNLAKYVPDYTAGSPPVVNQLGEFLTVLQRPVLFWYSNDSSENPNDIAATDVTVFYSSFAWLLSEEYQADGTEFKIRTTPYLAGVAQSAITDTISFSNAGLRYATHTYSGANDNSYIYNELVLEILTELSDGFISPITIEIRRVCNNPTAIKWKDKLGSWQVWVFEGNANRGHDVSSSDNVGIPFGDITTLTRTRKTLRKTEIPTLSVSADNLTLDEVKAIAEIQTSPNVLLCTSPFVDTDGESADDWVSIQVVDTSRIIYNEVLSKYAISFDFELIESFTINN